MLSLTPSLPSPVLTLRFMLHPVSYALLTFIYLIAAVWDPWTGPCKWPRGAPIVIAVLIGGGIALELAQMLTPRGAELSDIAGNVVGVTVGTLAWRASLSGQRGPIR